MPKKRKMHTRGENGRGEAVHYFASSVGEWQIDTDMLGLVERMKSGGMPFNLYLVPGSTSDIYMIESYAPQVKGAQWIAFVEFKT